MLPEAQCFTYAGRLLPAATGAELASGVRYLLSIAARQLPQVTKMVDD